jgi:WhiB family transcriptional regulator, redox-sensing transcriptional regulator
MAQGKMPSPLNRVSVRRLPVGEWTSRAACQGEAEEVLSGRGRTSREARKLCTACPVRFDCLGYALARGRDLKGYWGGTSEWQRQWLRARRGAVA